MPIPYNNETYVLKDVPSLKALINVALPYRKTKAFVTLADTVTLSGTYWDGGSRSTYTAVNIATLRVATAKQYNPPQFGGPTMAPKVELPPGVAIVEHGTFCGKPSTARVYVRPQDLAAWPGSNLQALAGVHLPHDVFLQLERDSVKESSDAQTE